MKFFSLTLSALIQTSAMGVLFFANAFFFFSDTDMDTSILILQIITGFMTVFGIVALILNRKPLRESSHFSTLQIIALIGLILFTLIATFGFLSSLI